VLCVHGVELRDCPGSKAEQHTHFCTSWLCQAGSLHVCVFCDLQQQHAAAGICICLHGWFKVCMLYVVVRNGYMCMHERVTCTPQHLHAACHVLGHDSSLVRIACTVAGKSVTLYKPKCDLISAAVKSYLEVCTCEPLCGCWARLVCALFS
jgi:hypothetical protein